MQVATTIAHARALFGVLPRTLGFVPTMGALHGGHLELVRRARAECAVVGVSIFVNPLQFGANEDLDRYPRDLEGDREKLATAGVDVLFAPGVSEIYPAGFATSIDVGDLGTTYEGAVRPGHFRGVATVVAKLLHIVQPDTTYLGQKDAQQTAVLRKMVRDLAFPGGVSVVTTVREEDGLAMSSRNAYLTSEQRSQAPVLHRALLAVRDAMERGAAKSDALSAARAAVGAVAAVDYFDVVDADEFRPLDRLQRHAFIIGAARFGPTRLLDNVYLA